MDTDLHFYAESPTPEARAACASCPVRDACLEHAVAHERYGFWGGTTERERRKIRRDRKIALDTPTLSALLTSTGHGTRADYLRHLRNGEEPCRSCKAGNAAVVRVGRKAS